MKNNIEKHKKKISVRNDHVVWKLEQIKNINISNSFSKKLYGMRCELYVTARVYLHTVHDSVRVK